MTNKKLKIEKKIDNAFKILTLFSYDLFKFDTSIEKQSYILSWTKKNILAKLSPMRVNSELWVLITVELISVILVVFANFS